MEYYLYLLLVPITSTYSAFDQILNHGTSKNWSYTNPREFYLPKSFTLSCTYYIGKNFRAVIEAQLAEQLLPTPDLYF